MSALAAPLSFGLVGAGAIAQSYVQAMRDLPFARLNAVADVRSEAARALAEGVGGTAYGSHEELLEKGRCDAVIVCTPPNSHPEICCAALSRGLPVLCEKPLAIDSASARRMLDTAERHSTFLTMGSKFRYVQDVVRAKSIVTSGILGEIVLFENAFTARTDMSQRWNADPPVSGGGVLIDNGTHSVDIVRYFLGPITEVHAVEGKRVQSLRVEDTVRIFVRTANEVMGSIDLSWSLNKELDSFIDIYGSRGTIRVGWRESKYRQSTSQDWIVFGNGYDKVQAFRSQIENFCRVIRGREALLITAEDAIASVEVIEAAYKSLGQNDWVTVGARKAA